MLWTIFFLELCVWVGSLSVVHYCSHTGNQDSIWVGYIPPAWKLYMFQLQLPLPVVALGEGEARFPNEPPWTGLQWSQPDVTSRGRGRCPGLMSVGEGGAQVWCLWEREMPRSDVCERGRCLGLMSEEGRSKRGRCPCLISGEVGVGANVWCAWGICALPCDLTHDAFDVSYPTLMNTDTCENISFHQLRLNTVIINKWRRKCLNPLFTLQICLSKETNVFICKFQPWGRQVILNGYLTIGKFARQIIHIFVTKRYLILKYILTIFQYLKQCHVHFIFIKKSKNQDFG